ncbi:MAG TPA: hypothetical protein VMR86_22375 [Myxococcota bacterium]|nr:hypothetical protein [Myxococcota bacterium]
MDQEPKLRSIPAGGFTGRSASAKPRDSQSRLQLALVIGLVVAVVLLVWSYVSLSGRIDSLESETRVLRTAVQERDDMISAQRSRLDEVRGRVQELLQLVDQPLAGPAAPTPDAPQSPPPSNP